MLEILTAEGRTLDDLLAELPASVGTAELHIAVADDRKFALIETIAAGFQIPETRLVTIDGIRVEFTDGWGLVRASNTSASLSCRFEAQDQAALQRIQKTINAELLRLVPDLELPFD